MKYETLRKRARTRAVNSAFRSGIDPVSRPETFASAVDAYMRNWELTHKKEDYE